jgi:transcriptional regulator with XRE-family HTH domain
VALLPSRVRGLLHAKKAKQAELVGVDQLGKWLCGDRQPSVDDLKRLAVALHATSDFLIGLGDDYGGDYELAAGKMSFQYFLRDVRVTPEQKRRCQRVFERDDILLLDGGPRTAEAWWAVARMVDAAVPPRPPQIGEARGA